MVTHPEKSPCVLSPLDTHVNPESPDVLLFPKPRKRFPNTLRSWAFIQPLTFGVHRDAAGLLTGAKT